MEGANKQYLKRPSSSLDARNAVTRVTDTTAYLFRRDQGIASSRGAGRSLLWISHTSENHCVTIRVPVAQGCTRHTLQRQA